MAVPEPAAPTPTSTSWDFSPIDPLMVDFMKSTEGHPRVFDFSTTPEWMWRTSSPVPVPPDLNTIDFGYLQGTALTVPLSKVGDYYRRLVSWYVRGGFTDELGREHRSNHHFKIDHWEVLNELEHSLSPQLYTQLYDEIVTQIRRVSPSTKFVGLAAATSIRSSQARPQLELYEYFLRSTNHRPDIPLDWISYHFYVEPKTDAVSAWAPDCFEQADHFFALVDRIEAIRKRLSPHARTAVDELGSWLPSSSWQPASEDKPIPHAYWNFSGAIYAYVFANLIARDINVVSESQLIGYPGQFPSVSMLDWNTGEPNARYRVLQLLLRHMQPGIAMCRPIASTGASAHFYGIGFRTAHGQRKVLLVNKRNASISVRVAGVAGGRIETVDEASGGGRARTHTVHREECTLSRWAVAVVTLPS